MKRWTWLWIVLAVTLTGALILYLSGRFPDALEGRGEQARLVHGVVLLLFLAAGAAVHRRMPAGHTLRSVLLWLGVGAVVFAGYAYRHDLAAVKDRLTAELMPHQGTPAGEGAVAIAADTSGHFVVEAEVDGVRLSLLVDTGASDVVLSPKDAVRLGFDLKALRYTRSYRTANGMVQGAPVRIGRIRIGPLAVDDVAASVNGAPMGRSLLGMSFLGRLSGFDVSRDTLTLRR